MLLRASLLPDNECWAVVADSRLTVTADRPKDARVGGGGVDNGLNSFELAPTNIESE